METEEKWKWRNLGIDKLRERGWSMERIAQKIGTDGSNLANILRRKAPYSRYVTQLDDLLTHEVYESGHINDVALLLEALVGIIKNKNVPEINY